MSSTKVKVALLVMGLLTLGGLLAQYRATTRGESVHLNAQQVELLINSMPEQQRNLYADPESRQRMLGMLQEAIIFGAEARRLGYTSRHEHIYQMGVQRDFLLSSAYRDRHREVTVKPEEVEAYFRQNPGAMDEFLRYNPQFGSRRQGIDQRLRQQLAEIRILAERARQEGLDRDPGVAMQLAYFPLYVLREALLKDLQAKVRVSDEEIEEFYHRHRSEFDQVRARHILFNTKPPLGSDGKSSPAPDPAAVRQKAEAVLKRAKAGEDFAQLAKEFSEDPSSKEQGGDLGFFGKGQMTPKFEEVAFSLSPGTISDIVETPFGLHIIKVEERRTAPLDQDLKGVIENRLRRRKHEEQLRQIRARHPVIVEGAKPPDEMNSNERPLRKR
ncbi:MAG: peptidyl-prolyl cis-trans isomerase [Acidobacteriota bacterium]|nr:peptidyl-prolyl cis-trans isomerase [Blastocatellia bacterium]MDW8239970.1 peptidyl-prolyl cis-trans isomerase [Acidobacteriota bacterium]